MLIVTNDGAVIDTDEYESKLGTSVRPDGCYSTTTATYRTISSTSQRHICNEH